MWICSDICTSTQHATGSGGELYSRVRIDPKLHLNSETLRPMFTGFSRPMKSMQCIVWRELSYIHGSDDIWRGIGWAPLYRPRRSHGIGVELNGPTGKNVAWRAMSEVTPRALSAKRSRLVYAVRSPVKHEKYHDSVQIRTSGGRRVAWEDEKRLSEYLGKDMTPHDQTYPPQYPEALEEVHDMGERQAADGRYIMLLTGMCRTPVSTPLISNYEVIDKAPRSTCFPRQRK